jgi:hypothetical protein
VPAFVENDKILVLTETLEFLKTCICHDELDSFLMLTVVFDEFRVDFNNSVL